MNKDSLFTPEEGVIPPGDTGPPYEDLIGYVWKRVWSWFRGTAEGGIYETLVDVSHYARGWWTWHVVSDPGEIKDGLPGWADHVYDYFQNWPTRAWEWFDNKVGRLEWTFRPTAEGGIWQHLSDTFDRFRVTFASFRNNPATFIYARLPQWIKDLKAFWQSAWKWIYDRIPQSMKDIWNNAKTWWDWVKWRWEDFKTEIGLFLDDPRQYIYDHIPLEYKQIWWNARTWWDWLKGRWDAFTKEIGLFLDDPRQYIYDHIPLEIKQIWWNAKTWWDWLENRWDDFTREVGAFIDDPYRYLTRKLQAWIEGWRDYIFGEVSDLFTQFANEIILKVMDWMDYTVPPIETMDDNMPHFSSILDFLEERALAWRTLKGFGVEKALADMEAQAAALRGEEPMEVPLPSEMFWWYWLQIPRDIRNQIGQPPIKG